MQIPALYPRLTAGATQQSLKGFPGALAIVYNPGLTVFELHRHIMKINCWHCLFRLRGSGQLTAPLWLSSFFPISQEDKGYRLVVHSTRLRRFYFLALKQNILSAWNILFPLSPAWHLLHPLSPSHICLLKLVAAFFLPNALSLQSSLG